MNKIYHLSTCSTCQRILSHFDLDKFEVQDIKRDPLTKDQLATLKEQVGSYEALFSRRAMKYRDWGLHEKTLTESDYKKYLLEEYTFLKRPVIIVDGQIYVGNSKKVIAQAVDAAKLRFT